MTIYHRIADNFRAAIPILALTIQPPEELNAIERIVRYVVAPLQADVFAWDLCSGLQQVAFDEDNGIEFLKTPFEVRNDPVIDVLDFIDKDYSKSMPDAKAIFILRDLHVFLQGDRADAMAIRRLKNLAFDLKYTQKRIVLLGRDIALPRDFDGLVTTLEEPLPGLEDVDRTIKHAIADIQTELAFSGRTLPVELLSEERERLQRAARGLTETEIADCIRIAAQRDRKIDDATADTLTLYKIEKLRRYRVDFSPPPDVEVGGLGEIKRWFAQRAKLFGTAARDYGLPVPKGILLAGLPGTGKSLIAKSLGKQWGVPVLSLDLGAIYDSLVGVTESNLRHILRTAEANAPCILFIDEIEKGLAGASGPSGDSGVSQRVFGTMLTWMADKTQPAFVIATANDASALPPEFLRKGRFDEVFFVDLPHPSERRSIVQNHLQKYGSQLDSNFLDRIADATEHFSGAELGAAVESAAIAAFDRDEPGVISADDILHAIELSVPLAVQTPERVEAYRNALQHARPASLPERQDTSVRRRRTPHLM